MTSSDSRLLAEIEQEMRAAATAEIGRGAFSTERRTKKIVLKWADRLALLRGGSRGRREDEKEEKSDAR